MSRSALISGAYGYVGSVLRDALESSGWTTIALVRTPKPGDRAIMWSLGKDAQRSELPSADALIHCAYDQTLTAQHDIWQTNVHGSKELLHRAAKSGISRILNISSMSAYPGTLQLYGKAKLEIEQETLNVGGISVRPGLVYGPRAGGMTGTLRRLAQLPVVPVLRGEARQYPIQENDLARAILLILEARTWEPEVFGIAHPDGIPFASIIRELGRGRTKGPILLPVPRRAVLETLRLAERLHVPLPVRSDSLRGLVSPAPYVPESRAFPNLLADLHLFPDGL